MPSLIGRCGGGGSITEQTGLYFGNDVSVADGVSALLTWDSLSNGQAVLNLGVPDTPTVVASGNYAVTVQITSDELPVPAAANTRGFLTLIDSRFPGQGIAVDLFDLAVRPVTTSDIISHMLTATSWLEAGSSITAGISYAAGGAGPNVKFALRWGLVAFLGGS